MLGLSEAELLGRPFLEFVHPDDREATTAAASALARGNAEVADFANRYRSADGAWVWLLWSARSDNHRIYAVAKDITERKVLEEERERLLERVEAMAN